MSQNNPKHIAIIMDGNRRWAKKRALSTFLGHRAGVENVRKIVRAARKLRVKYLTLYTFSTENWKRSKEEVKYLMGLIERAMTKYIDEFDQQNARVNIFGDLEDFPPKLQKIIQVGVKKLAKNNGLVLNLALNYGGRAEILMAAQEASRKKEFSEKNFAKHLYSGKAKVPDPDLIIRTGGEMRLSNFLLWQAAYSELYFSEKMWPDFSEKDLKKAIKDFQDRKRRFGK